MRRLMLMGAAVLLILTSAPAAQAQYAPPAPTPTPTPTPTATASPTPTTSASPTQSPSPSATPTTSTSPTPEPTATTGTDAPTPQPSATITVTDADGVTFACIVLEDATLTTPGAIRCAGTGLMAGTTFTVSLSLQVLPDFVTAATFDTRARAVAFVGAQATTLPTLNASGTGTVAADGSFSLDLPAPIGACTQCPITATLIGTAANGDVVAISETVPGDPGAIPGDGTGQPAESPKTGAESALLALIALGLVGGGAGAVHLSRRRSLVDA